MGGSTSIGPAFDCIAIFFIRCVSYATRTKERRHESPLTSRLAIWTVSRLVSLLKRPFRACASPPKVKTQDERRQVSFLVMIPGTIGKDKPERVKSIVSATGPVFSAHLDPELTSESAKEPIDAAKIVDKGSETVAVAPDASARATDELVDESIKAVRGPVSGPTRWRLRVNGAPAWPELVEGEVDAAGAATEAAACDQSPSQSPRSFSCSPPGLVSLSGSFSVSSSFSLCSSPSESESVSQSAVPSEATSGRSSSSPSSSSPSSSSPSSSSPSSSSPSSSSPSSSSPSSSSSFTVREDQTWQAPKGLATQASELTRMLKELDNAGHPDTPTNPDHGSPGKPTIKPLKSCLKKTSSVGPDAVRCIPAAKKKVRFDTVNNRMNVEDGAIRLEVITYIPTPEASPVKESPGIKKSTSPWRGGRAAARRALEETLSDPSIVAEYQDIDGLDLGDFIDYKLDICHVINFFGQRPGGW